MSSDVLDLTNDLGQLVDLAATPAAVDELLRRGLDWVSKLAPYDLATVLELDGERLRVRASRGPLARDVKTHELSLARFPSIREALETRRARAFTEEDHAHGDGDPFDGVLDLPHGHACMVIPLCAGERRFGVMTLDRSECVSYSPEVVQLVEVYGQVLALAIMHAEKQVTLDRLHEDRRAHAKALEEELAGDPFGVLESTRSVALRDIVRRARQVSTTATPVLIMGETGTGKERLARAIHLWSPRAEHSFVTINCAAIPENLIESELFGHVRGAFTGAARDRPGRFQVANHGTLLLDEIGELPLSLQAKLLRVLQEGTFEPVGSDRTIKVDVRVLAATHVDLLAAVAAGRFREDLYYRLAVFPLSLPALRERREDLEGLCSVLLEEQARRTGKTGLRVSPEGLACLARYGFPGNLRELGNVLERATILAGSDARLGPEHFDLDTASRTRIEPRAHEDETLVTLAEMEARYIRRVLDATKGRVYGEGGAAEVLGIPPSTLQSRMKKLGVARVS